ncbi:MAG TPA: protein translocase subunit SecD [Woeseiaceae bacterium]|nr:protein translocase subunit SecD [Woeseiaceae bacterium]
MNRYPTWLNLLVLGILLLGIVFALPNVYGTVPAVQVAAPDDGTFGEAKVAEVTELLVREGVTPEAAYVDAGRVVLRFDSVAHQEQATSLLRERYDDAGVSPTLAPALPGWLRALGLEPMSLGLDLRGGVHILLEVDVESAIASRLATYQQNIDSRLRDANIRHRVDLDGRTLTVRLTSEADAERARDIISRADPGLLIFDGADDRTLSVRMSEQQIAARRDFAIQQNTTTLRSRVDELGVSEPVVQRQGLDRIVVQLPGVQDPNRLDDILTATATVEFRLVDLAGDSPGSRRYPGRGAEESQVLKREVIASGDQIIDAEAGFSEGQPAVFITLDGAGGESMLVTTRNNLQKPMSTVFIETHRDTIMRNGEPTHRVTRTEEIISTATINGIFKDRFVITGLNAAEARDLALLLRAGALAAPVYKIEERTIGPSLGQENIERGFQAVTIGFVAVVIFMVFYYKWFGLIANLALLSNLVFIVALLSLLQASLTLPGIAGIVLTVGMALDANILIFERIREELAAGISPQTAISSGYEKAFSSIADANVTTLIAGLVLFLFGTGPIKGFAVTLSLGIITSMFTAVVGTRSVVNLVYGGRKVASVPV